MVIYSVHPINPQRRFLESVVKILKNDNGIAVYPTDTVYGMGASITNPKALDKINTLMHKDKSRFFSFICSDFSQVSRYVTLSNSHYRLMKRYLPGPFTFILPASSLVPKKIFPKRKTVGVRIPDYPAILQLVGMLGEPLANTSLPLSGSLRGDPEQVKPVVLNEVDVMLDAGPLVNPTGSTIVDLTGEKPVLIRQAKGIWLETD